MLVPLTTSALDAVPGERAPGRAGKDFSDSRRPAA
jgi:hypothetical protein